MKCFVRDYEEIAANACACLSAAHLPHLLLDGLKWSSSTAGKTGIHLHPNAVAICQFHFRS